MDALFDRRPPSSLELFVANPLRFLAEHIYRWSCKRRRGIIHENLIRVVCISDTHGYHDEIPPLPSGDILIHAGDLTQSGTPQELGKALGWFSEQPHQYKVYIAGNHDRALSESDIFTTLPSFPNLIYLEETSATVTINGRKLHIYGSPLTPKHGSWAFQYEREAAEWSAIPLDTDILVTHGPPAHHLDLNGTGCRGLLDALWRVRPTLHVFGHIHAARGVERLDWSDAQASYDRICSGIGNWKDLVRLLFGALQRGVHRTVLVNAASLGGFRDEQRRGAIVVDI
ncbi:Metallo-dependent phosphatase [Lentinula aff. detonsa]|nr:Metallo-dependent phosphatase [Lentinula aff. detonsa]